MKKLLAYSLIVSSLFASGWRIPEQSSNSIALAGAYVANANGADSSYHNPANMSFNKDKDLFDFNLNYIYLSPIKYNDLNDSAKNGESKAERFLVPTLFYTHKLNERTSFGFSLTAPGGLSKKWDTPEQAKYSKEFTLKIIEFNPVVSYLVNDNFSVAGGLRLIYSNGVVKNEATTASREMKGDTVAYGFNLAMTYKLKNQTFSVTYRSNVNLKEKGNAKLYLSGVKVYDGGANVTIPLPAVLSLAYALNLNKTIFEFVFERTYWSKYKNLDFNYDSPIPSLLQPAFDDAKPRNWKDVNAYRFGITHQLNEKITLLAGFAYDNTPMNKTNMGYELPGSDAKIYSFGINYKYNKNATITFSYLYDDKKDITITTDDNNEQNINGKFTNISAQIVNLGVKYRF